MFERESRKEGEVREERVLPNTQATNTHEGPLARRAGEVDENSDKNTRMRMRMTGLYSVL